jgi:hypothetical protein
VARAELARERAVRVVQDSRVAGRVGLDLVATLVRQVETDAILEEVQPVLVIHVEHAEGWCNLAHLLV